MKHTAIFTLLLLPAATGCGLVGGEEHEASVPYASTLAVAEGQPVHVEFRAGRLQLRRAGAANLHANGTLVVKGPSSQLAMERASRLTPIATSGPDGAILGMEVPPEGRDWEWRVDAQVLVPRSAPLHLDVAAGDLDLEGPWPEVQVRSAASRIRYRGDARALDLTTAAGDVEVLLPDGWAGRGTIRSEAGAVTVRCAGRLAVPVQTRTTVGRVEFLGPRPELLDAGAPLPTGGGLRIEATVGSITIQQEASR